MGKYVNAGAALRAEREGGRDRLSRGRDGRMDQRMVWGKAATAADAATALLLYVKQL